MKKLLPLLFFIIMYCKSFGQEYIFGKVTTERNLDLQGVEVINIITEEKTYTDYDGNFMIMAKSGHELRFVKPKFQRAERKINSEDFKNSIHIVLEKAEILIPEIELAFKATGDLKKDVKVLNKSSRTIALSQEMNIYMKKPLYEVRPQLKTPSAFEKPSVNAAQVDLIQLAGFVSKLIRGKSKPKFLPSPKQKENFLILLRKNLTDEYFLTMNLKPEEIDTFLKFAEQKLQLTQNFTNDYNLSKIKLELEKALESYQKTKS